MTLAFWPSRRSPVWGDYRHLPSHLILGGSQDWTDCTNALALPASVLVEMQPSGSLVKGSVTQLHIQTCGQLFDLIEKKTHKHTHTYNLYMSDQKTCIVWFAYVSQHARKETGVCNDKEFLLSWKWFKSHTQPYFFFPCERFLLRENEADFLLRIVLLWWERGQPSCFSAAKYDCIKSF